MDLSRFIEKPLRELKSTFREYSSLSYQERGLLAELWVGFRYLERGYFILGFRHKTPFYEIDLLFHHPIKKEIVLVEVKTLTSHTYLVPRVSPSQQRRLVRAIIFVAEKYQKNTQVHWAFVDPLGKITILEAMKY